MDRGEFTKLLAKRFYPELREAGFKGSGATLRRIDEPLVHVFNVQRSAGGQGFYINLGAHLAFLDDARPLQKVLEHGCAFRTRLDPLTRTRVHRWPYGRSEKEALGIIDEVSGAWRTNGQRFFQTYAEFPASFETLVREANATAMHPDHVLTLAKIARHLGDCERAQDLVQTALPRVNERARSLIGNMKMFLKALET